MVTEEMVLLFSSVVSSLVQTGVVLFSVPLYRDTLNTVGTPAASFLAQRLLVQLTTASCPSRMLTVLPLSGMSRNGS